MYRVFIDEKVMIYNCEEHNYNAEKLDISQLPQISARKYLNELADEYDEIQNSMTLGSLKLALENLYKKYDMQSNIGNINTKQRNKSRRDNVKQLVELL